MFYLHLFAAHRVIDRQTPYRPHPVVPPIPKPFIHSYPRSTSLISRIFFRPALSFPPCSILPQSLFPTDRPVSPHSMDLCRNQVMQHKTLGGMSATRSRATAWCKFIILECESHTCFGKEAVHGSMERHTIDRKSWILGLHRTYFRSLPLERQKC